MKGLRIALQAEDRASALIDRKGQLRFSNQAWQNRYPYGLVRLQAFRQAANQAISKGKLVTCRLPFSSDPPRGNLFHVIPIGEPGKLPFGVRLTEGGAGADALSREKRRHLRERLFRLEHALGDGVYDWDLKHDRVHFSARWYEMLGFEDQALPPQVKTWRMLLHPEDRAQTEKWLDALIAGHATSFEQQYRLRTSHGGYRWFLTRGRIFRDSRGKARRMLGTHADITDLKRTEAESQRRQNFLATMLEHMPLAVTLKRTQSERFGEIIMWNHAAEDLYGVTAETAIGQNIFHLIPSQDAEIEDWYDRQAVMQQAPVQVQDQSVHNRFRGARIARSVRLCIESADSSEPVLLALSEDVTEEVTSRYAKEASDKRHSQVLQNLHEVVFQTDAKGAFTLLNPAWIKLTGYMAEDSLGDTFCHYIPTDTRCEFREAIKKVFETEESQLRLNICIQHQDGTIREGEMRAWVERNNEGHPLGLSGTVVDVTERNDREQRLTLAMNRADVLVHELAISNEQLERSIEHANKMALEASHANSAKSRFLAQVSHDIRTPLNGILGFLPLLQRAGIGKREQQYVGWIEASAQTLLSLINDLLDLSKIEAGQMELNATAFSLGDILEVVTNTFTAKIQQKDIALHARVEEPVPGVLYGDNRRLTQLLFNLVGNAVKFTRKGEVRVTLKATSSQDESDEITVTGIIEDTGPGIPPDKREAVFSPFVQVNRADEEEENGTGLGLAICRQLCRLMGGKIDLTESAEGGCRFTFQLEFERAPKLSASTDSHCEDDHDRETEGEETSYENNSSTEILSAHNTKSAVSSRTEPCLRTISAPTASTNDKPAKRSPRVLVVDDNTINRELMQATLEMEGIEVVTASDGTNALEAWDEEGYDLILMDIRMPGMDGLETTEYWRQREREEQREPACIIALSADIYPSDIERSEHAGMNGYLTKPLPPDALERILQSLRAGEMDQLTQLATSTH